MMRLQVGQLAQVEVDPDEENFDENGMQNRTMSDGTMDSRDMQDVRPGDMPRTSQT